MKTFEINLNMITAEDVFAIEEKEVCGKKVFMNKFGFDPNRPAVYLWDEYWDFSEDFRYWCKISEKVRLQMKAVERANMMINYKVIKTKSTDKDVEIQLLGKDSNGTLWGAIPNKKFVVVYTNPVKVIHEFATVKAHVCLQRIFETPSGENVVVVYCDQIKEI